MISFPHLLMQQTSYSWSLSEDANVNKRVSSLEKKQKSQGKDITGGSQYKANHRVLERELTILRRVLNILQVIKMGESQTARGRGSTQTEGAPCGFFKGFKHPAWPARFPKAPGLSFGHMCPTGQGVCGARIGCSFLSILPSNTY